jgi:hypothetical protein
MSMIGLEPQTNINMPAGIKPMVKELAPGRLFMAPLTYYGYNPASDDANIFNQANAYLMQKYGQGTIELAGMTFIGRSQATPTWGNNLTNPTQQNTFGNVNVIGQGQGNTIWQQTGFTGNAWYVHRSTSYGAQYGLPAQPHVGHIRDILIDGTNAGAGSVGLHYGDGWGDGRTIDVGCVNYSAAGSVGAWQQNTIAPSFWFEKNTGIYLNLSNNAIAMNIDAGAGSNSSEYNEYHISMFCQSNQQGIQLLNGVNMGGSNLFLYGNMQLTSATTGNPPTNNVAMLSLFSGSRWYYGTIMAKIESNSGTLPGTNTPPWTIWSDGSGYIRQCDGRIVTSLNDIKMQGAEFGFAGFIGGNPAGGLLFPTGNPGSGGTSTSPPAVPASNTWFHNTSVGQSVTISGGTVSSIKVGTPTTNITLPTTSANFSMPPGAYFNVTYTVAPSITWVPTGAGD